MFSSQGIGSGLVSFYMIFEALQSALFGFNFHSLSSKTLKIPEFNLLINNFLINFFHNFSSNFFINFDHDQFSSKITIFAPKTSFFSVSNFFFIFLQNCIYWLFIPGKYVRASYVIVQTLDSVKQYPFVTDNCHVTRISRNSRKFQFQKKN